MERGKVVLDGLFDHAFTWCLANLPVEPVCLGAEERELVAIDTSTIARLRAGARLALAGKGFCHRAGRAVRANIVAAATSIVMIGGCAWGWYAARVLAHGVRRPWRRSFTPYLPVRASA